MSEPTETRGGDASGRRGCGPVAGLGTRSAARAIDAVVTAVLAGAAVLAVMLVLSPLLLAALAQGFAQSWGQSSASSGGSGVFGVATVLMIAAAAGVPARYEALQVFRGRQTAGKQMAYLAVVAHPRDGSVGLTKAGCWVRWAVPHGALAAGAAVGWGIGSKWDSGLIGAAATGMAAWTAVYASVLLDGERRGWHDRAAGTVVIAEPRDDKPDGLPPEPPAIPTLRKPVAAMLIAAASLGAGAAAAAGAYLFDFITDNELDLYDEQVRANNRYRFWTGPDGDVCWHDDGVIYCDLESIGGLHWNSGEPEAIQQIFLGPGYLCSLADGGSARCWEWSRDVSPRPARAPERTAFSYLEGAAGFVCGDTPDFAMIVCWTIGTDPPVYREVIHRANDDTELSITGSAENNPSRIGYSVRPRGARPGHFTSGIGVFDPFARQDPRVWSDQWTLREIDESPGTAPEPHSLCLPARGQRARNC